MNGTRFSGFLVAGGSISPEQIVTYGAIVVFACVAAWYWLKVGRKR